MIINIVSTKEELHQIVQEELAKAKANITENIEREGKRASGKTAEGMAITVADEGSGVVGTLSGRAYFSALETGSKPWRNQYKSAPKFFADIIAEWANAKGVTANPYAIATKIMREGTKQHRDGPITTIYSEEIDATYDRIEKRVMLLFDTILTESLKR